MICFISYFDNIWTPVLVMAYGWAPPRFFKHLHPKMYIRSVSSSQTQADLHTYVSAGENETVPKARHYNDVIMNAMASRITVSIVCLTIYSGADKRKHQGSASLAVVRAIHRWPVNSLHKVPVTRKMFPFDDVIMFWNNVYMSECFISANLYTQFNSMRPTDAYMRQ